jgi:DNA primase
LQKEIVVVPDRDTAGLKLVKQAIELGWSVSMPEWPDDVKDINDAVTKFGKLYTMWAIASAIESNSLKIQLRMKKWAG